jgi:hypothetical protein
MSGEAIKPLASTDKRSEQAVMMGLGSLSPALASSCRIPKEGKKQMQRTQRPTQHQKRL